MPYVCYLCFLSDFTLKFNAATNFFIHLPANYLGRFIGCKNDRYGKNEEDYCQGDL